MWRSPKRDIGSTSGRANNIGQTALADDVKICLSRDSKRRETRRQKGADHYRKGRNVGDSMWVKEEEEVFGLKRAHPYIRLRGPVTAQ